MAQQAPQAGTRIGRLLGQLLQDPTLVALLGPPSAPLLAALDQCDLGEDDANFISWHGASNRQALRDPRMLATIALRTAPETWTAIFAAHGVDAADLADRITWGSPRPVADPLVGSHEVLIEALNDDYTPMDSVVALLHECFEMDLPCATEVMLRVHREGSAALVRMPASAAQALLEDAESWCREHLIGLRFRIVSDPDRVAVFGAVPTRRSAPSRGVGWWQAGIAALLVIAFGLLLSSEDPGRQENRSYLPEAPAPVVTDAQRRQVESAFAPYRDALAATSREVVRIELEPDAVDEPWSSKVGGTPYLPAGASLPMDPDQPDKPMGLLAQIDFAELPPLVGYPRQGLLQFFIADDPQVRHFGNYQGDRERQQSQQRYFRVIYWPEQTGHVGTGGAKARAWPLMDEQALRMRFRADREEMTPFDVDFIEVVGVDPYALTEKLAQTTGLPDTSVAELMPLKSGGGSQLGGWPTFTQDDPRPNGTHLRLLLQLDSDGNLMWGDAGVGHFFIDPEDLARADFTRVMYNWDCH